MSNVSKIEKVLYTAHAEVAGGREGHGETSDGQVKVDLRLPKEMGGNGGGTNPEQLFAIGYAACFEGAVRFVAGQKKVKVDGASVKSSVGIGPREGSGFAINAKLEVSLPGVDDATAHDIVKTAHEQVCPYSHATRGNIDVEITVNGKAVA
ncbi:organic hydroperoxide resistance protein [Luteibacter pinisoli]|jgi:Ohr subfamily peroxiredoxin|uniref:Organic hydroperoxide resistance protein n=1 Tax=Luteibacter pinisoli TaxID=2589080 RepID=A0A4Y5Z594_9GAMM|nr:organic hydroperoxide resistance protein [Luteibacter pinisoli]QDE40337.1 organic hydroperoxide resistance protein [Luteibacter pinisoli]